MIEHDRVLFLPTKMRNRVEVVVVKKMTRQFRAAVAAIERSIDQLGRQVDKRRGKLRQVQQCPPINSRTEFFSQRIDEARNPFVILSAINPGGNLSAAFYLGSQRTKSALRIRQMM